MSYQLRPVTKATLPDGPPVCHECTFWQSRSGRTVTKSRWAERVEEEWGAWGTLYAGDGDRLLGFIQYGPSGFFARADALPAGPPSQDAVLITCAYLVDPSSPWVMQSLFLSVIGEARDRKVRAIEAFGYRYPEGTGPSSDFSRTARSFPRTSSQTSASTPFDRLVASSLRGSSSEDSFPPRKAVSSRAWRTVKELATPAPVPEGY